MNKASNFTKISTSILAIAAAGAMPSFAMAQDAADTVSADDADANVIIVTAQKRSENVQDVGISITALGTDQLDQLRIRDAASLTENVPNMSLADSGDSAIPIFVIRGVGLQDYNTNNTPTTALVVDDVYQPFGVYGSFAMFDMERIEVLKGPQGGLYGRNSTGGAINLVTRRPSFDSLEANAEFEAGSYGMLNFRGGVSVPLGEMAAFRFAAQLESSNGYYFNTLLDRHQGGKNKLQMRGTLELRPTDNLTAVVRYTHGEDRSEVGIPELEGYLDPNVFWEGPLFPFSPSMNIPYNADGTPAFCPSVLATGIPDSTCITTTRKTPDGIYRGEESSVKKFDDNFDSIGLNLDLDLGFANLLSITNYTKMRFAHPNGSGSRGLGPGQDEAAWSAFAIAMGRVNNGNLDDNYITYYNDDIKSWSQELRLVSGDSGPLSWMVGGVYADDKINSFRTCVFPSSLLFDWVYFPGCGNLSFKQDTKAWSVYGQLAYEITDQLKFTADLRYTDEKKKYRDGTVLLNDGAWTCFLFGLDPADTGPGGCAALAGYNPETGEIPLVEGTNNDYRKKEPSWKATLDYKPLDDVLLYASVGRSFKSGGFFGGFFFDPGEIVAYEPEINTAYEVGFKSTLASGDLRLNGAVFRYDYKNFQGNLSTPDPNSTAVFSGLTNLGDVRTWGAELELDWKPVPGLILRTALGYLDTEVTKIAETGLSVESGTTNILGEIVSTVGNQLNHAPHWSSNSMARYEFPVSNSIDAAMQVTLNWTSDYFLSVSNEPYSREKGVALLNARLELFQAGSSGWKVALWGQNLTKKKYRTSTLDDGINNNYSNWNAPRTIGVALSYDY
ncbi:TonB-dependent receptor [Altererythrobacter sp.]|uniref:TonB-dependent receptor n=1 Tax=Altererythrobacter sp. TaxID=1872480 RepID=UPI003D012E21